MIDFHHGQEPTGTICRELGGYEVCTVLSVPVLFLMSLLIIIMDPSYLGVLCKWSRLL